MAKLTEFVTPTGTRGNILSVSSWLSLILGGVAFLIALATAQKIVGMVPSNPVLDTKIEPLISQPSTGGVPIMHVGM